MSNDLFVHKDCGGRLHADIIRAFEWSSPSISLTPMGLKIGVTEFKARSSSKKGGIMWVCEECGEEFSSRELDKNMEVVCQICGRSHSPKESYNCPQILIVCETCTKIVTGKAQPTSVKQQKIVEFVFIKGNPIQFVPLMEILSKPVGF